MSEQTDSVLDEQWKQIPWAPMYDVSTHGRIRSWVIRRSARTTYTERASEPRILKLQRTYACVYTMHGEYYSVSGKRLAAEIFGESNVQR